MDEQQVLDDALEVLKEIRSRFRGERIADLAGRVSQLIRPTMAFDSSTEESDRRRKKLPIQFAKESARIVGRKSKIPSFKTPVFKCLEDYVLPDSRKSRSLSQAQFC
jgi:hypothetical protein